jgi:transcriptional regulator MraZ
MKVFGLTSIAGFSTIGVEFCGKNWLIVVTDTVFRGNAPARVDDKGRLKVPNSFRSVMETKYGRELFVTSLTGEFVRIYPMPVWLEVEEKVGGMPSSHPARLRFLDRVNYFGQTAELDVQGRVLIPMRLRETASMAGEVDVLGQYNCLDVWNHDRFESKLKREPFSDEDARALSGYGI